MDKPILIDALHITMGGGKVLLEYLVENMVKRQMNFHLLRDERCPMLNHESVIGRVYVMSDSGSNRKNFYKAHKNDYASVFCFGNIPAPIKMPCPVHTYFHNVNLLAIPTNFDIKKKLTTWLKRTFIKSLSKNTDTWIVQTQNTEDLVCKYLPCKGKQVVQFPFYNLPEDAVAEICNSAHGDDYVLVGGYSWNRGHEELVEAWGKLAEKGFRGKLHLTVKTISLIQSQLDKAVGKGAVIENHGFIPYAEVLELYRKCKAIVYPSHGESFGLGLVEAIECGCDVIGADLPYTYCACDPSETFKAGDANAIAEAVLKYEQGISKKSKKLIENKINELITYITNI